VGNGKIPEVSFTSLVSFLATIALQHLGVIKNPLSKEVEKDLELAKYSIDMLDILKEKTKGNLTKDEENFLINTLADLKLSFVRIKDGESKHTETDRGKKEG
jgi:hypothetical protein